MDADGQGIFVRMRYSELLAVPVVKGMKSEEDLWTLVIGDLLQYKSIVSWIQQVLGFPPWIDLENPTEFLRNVFLFFDVNHVFRPCLHVWTLLTFWLARRNLQAAYTVRP